MKRWNPHAGKDIENLKIDAFLKEITEVCKKHNLSISHEDGHGSFAIESFNDHNIKWLMSASDDTKINIK